jgi:hypothetical protein
VSADSLTVNATAAMNGSNYGLQVNHNNTSRSYVQDNTPSGETVYRADFLFNAQSVTGQMINFRQEIFRTLGTNPNPGVGSCPADPAAIISMMRLWLYQTGGSGQTSNIQLWSAGNQCGQRGTTRFPIVNGQDYRVCIEWTTGPTNTGHIGLWVGPVASSCPSSGDPAWATSPMTNSLTATDFIRMGTPSTNSFGAGETAVLYFDEFESFRTVTP